MHGISRTLINDSDCLPDIPTKIGEVTPGREFFLNYLNVEVMGVAKKPQEGNYPHISFYAVEEVLMGDVGEMIKNHDDTVRLACFSHFNHYPRGKNNIVISPINRFYGERFPLTARPYPAVWAVANVFIPKGAICLIGVER